MKLPPETKLCFVRRMYARRKGGVARATSELIVLTVEELTPLFDRPLIKAAGVLGISPTSLKIVCRKLRVTSVHILLSPPVLVA